MVQTSEFRLVYETPVAVSQSGAIGLSYLGKGPLFVKIIDLTDTNQNRQKHLQVVQLAKEAAVSGFRCQGFYKFYLLKNMDAPSGVYLGPHFSYSTYKMTFKRFPGFYEIRTHVNFNFLFGYQGLIAHTVAIDIFTGFGLKDNFYEYRLTANSVPVREKEESLIGDAKISIGFNIGFVNFKHGSKMLHP